MPAITVQQLNDAALDVAHITAVATSTAETVEDRFGIDKLTMVGAVVRMQQQINTVTANATTAKAAIESTVDTIRILKNKGAWSPLTAYEEKDVAFVGSTWYFCIADHTSSALFATDEIGKWSVHQVNSIDALGFPSNDEIEGIAVGEVPLRVSQLQGQVTITAGYSVVDPKNSGKWHTALAAGCFILAEHIEENRPYHFRVAKSSSFNLVIDLGPAGYLNGTDTNVRAIELRGGESITIIRVTSYVFFVVSHHSVDYENTDDATFAYTKTGANTYKMWRRFTVSAGATITAGISASYQAPSAKRLLGIGLVNNVAGNYSPISVVSITDTGVTVHNPNASALTIDLTIGNLKKVNA